MSEKRFFIKNFGEFEYIVTLLSLDYPETFVAKKVNSECELYIFDEIKNEQQSVTWICCAITVDELDGLNKGTITLNSCFYGPRKSKKPGYLVTSSYGNEEAIFEKIDDVSRFVSDIDVYVPQFVEDNHGSGVLSLATGKAIFSIVLDASKYANPFFDVTRLTNSATNGKAFLKSLPYNIDIKNNKACIQSNQSIVINFEITDKPNEPFGSKQMTLEQVDEQSKNVESFAALDAIEKAFNSGNDNEKLISALSNNKNAIKKYNRFIKNISKNKDKQQFVQMIRPNADKAHSTKIVLDRNYCKELSTNADDSLIIVGSDNKKTGTLTVCGYFQMFDLKNYKGEGKFRLIDENGNIYRGTTSNEFTINSNPIVIDGSKDKYLVKMKTLYYIVDERITDQTYELVSVEKETRKAQLKLSV